MSLLQFKQQVTAPSKLDRLRSSHPEMFLGNVVLKMCNKFTGEHPCQSETSIALLCNFIKIIRRHGCCPVNLQHTFGTLFLKITSEGLLVQGHFFNYVR